MGLFCLGFLFVCFGVGFFGLVGFFGGVSTLFNTGTWKNLVELGWGKILKLC